jgi:putative CocE/NonD family hydrolase
MIATRFAGFILAGFVSASLLPAQGLEHVKANFTKYEFRIPMRDGKRLFTSVYAPKDTSQSYPILLLRTPYSIAPYGSDNYRENLGPSEKLAKEGNIFAYQDVRGRWKSEGEFIHARPHISPKRGREDVDESTDTYDTIDWLVKNVPNNNGRVGMYGISYPGFYAAMGVIDAHPALKASSPQAPVADWFIGDDWRHNGVFFLAHAFNFFASFTMKFPEPGTFQPPYFDHGTPDAYDFFLRMGPIGSADSKHLRGEAPYWRELIEHDTYDDFWKARNIRPRLMNIKPAVMTVGGWYDAEDLLGPLAVYRAIEGSTPGASNMVVIGPWSHGQWGGGDADGLGDVKFGSKTGVFYRDEIEAAFFNRHLKDKGETKLPEAYMFETGTNQWRKFDAWPPKNTETKKFYLQGSGRLTTEPPGASGLAFDEYVSDPAKPVPFIGGTFVGMAYAYMTADQRFASRRTDVLAYQTDEVEEDLVVAGPLRASLQVSTTGTDSDWVVKLIDVYPDNFPTYKDAPPGVRMGGYQQLVRGEPFRGKFRNSFEKPEPFEPGKVSKVEFVLPDVNHSFRRGHRIMIHVQSSWFPLTDRNPQKFMPIHTARESDFQKATQRVYRSASHPSSLTVHVLK